MSEVVIVTIFLALVVGQAIALFRGRVAAVKYYICVAPLGYFDTWFVFTWAPARVCGLLLIFAGLTLWRNDDRGSAFLRHPLAKFTAYIIVTTLVGSLLWPVEAMEGPSAVYSSARGVVQILNWMITIGVGWEISKAFSRSFLHIRPTIIWAGCLHSAYAIYQVVAYYTGLPFTGLRRAAEGLTTDAEGEQLALTQYADMLLYRATSLVGEPKSFGAISLLWIAAVLTLYLERKATAKHRFILSAMLVALALTYSTTAWAGVLVAIAVFIKLSGFRSANLLGAGFLIAALLSTMLSSGILTLSADEILGIVTLRTSDRLFGEASELLEDLPEVETRKILAAHPEMLIFGTGLGGISFYIAENLGGGISTILFPNLGILGFICDLGLVGTAFLVFCLRRGLRPVFSPSAPVFKPALVLSFLGVVLFVQCFIFGGGLLPFALASLLASERIVQSPNG